MGEESWHRARLIPTSGISGAEERERRATSALLAVLTAVEGFGQGLLKPLGAPAGKLGAFIEVPFDLGDQRLYPDGLLRVSRGAKQWTVLVEVKTKDNKLDPQQVQNYLDIAKREGFDGVLTISNQIAMLPTVHPTGIEGRKLRGLSLFHLSWTQISTEAVMQKVHRGVSDPEQAWILEELIRYLEHDNSGALEFEDMGDSWVAVREALQNGTFRPNDKGVAEVASRWSQLMQFLSLRLGKQLGLEVQPVIPRDHLKKPELYLQSIVESLTKKAAFEGAIRIPKGISPIVLTADLRAGQIAARIDVDAPSSGRPLTKINWVRRQLEKAPDGVRIDSHVANGRGVSNSELLKRVREDPEVLLDSRKRDIKSFSIVLSAPMGAKRSGVRGGFVQSVCELTDLFYASVVTSIKAADSQPPKQRQLGSSLEPTYPQSIASADLSSQDGPQVASVDLSAEFGSDA